MPILNTVTIKVLYAWIYVHRAYIECKMEVKYLGVTHDIHLEFSLIQHYQKNYQGNMPGSEFLVKRGG